MKRIHPLSILLGFATLIGVWLWLASLKTPQPPPVPAPIPEESVSADTVDFDQPAKPAPINTNPAASTAIPDFATWARNYLNSTDQEKTAILAEGIRLARERRPVFEYLIQNDPEMALRQAVPMVTRQALPPSLLAWLEERVQGYGDLETFAVSEPVPGVPAVTREVRISDTSYQAFTYGRRAVPALRKNVALHGVAIDQFMAVDESPIRPLEIGEIPPTGTVLETNCPVSGKTTPVELGTDGSPPPVTASTPAAQEGTVVRYYCDGGHIVEEIERLLDEELTANESSTGGSSFPTGSVPSLSKEGYRTILYMRCIFPDDLKVMQSETEAYDHLKTMNDYFHEISYGKLYFLSTVTPVVMLPRTSAYYTKVYADSTSTTELINDAKEVARQMGFPIEQYQHHIMIYSNNGPGSFGGRASAPGSNMWLKTTSTGTFWHEMGHNLGPIHANFWDTDGKSAIGPGKNVEYGNSFDVMGSSSSGSNGHFNASFKQSIGWLTSDLFTTVNRSGTYRIWQYDQPIADIGKRFALKIIKDSQRDYWVEFRQKFTTNAWITNGVHLNWDRWGTSGETSTSGSNSGSSLIDTTPGTTDAKNDAALVIGRTFSDRENGIHITPVAKNSTTPPSMDVAVRFDDGLSNNNPSLNLSSSVTSVATGVTVNFTATASDPDGDPIAYYWDFNDSSVNLSNLPTASKSWSTAGHYAVKCTASDLRGGWIRRTILITVGSPTTFTISGSVLDGSGNPVPDVAVHIGTVSNTSRRALTDSAGIYHITRLTSGSSTLTAVRDAWNFTLGFTNPVTVGPSATARNFTAGPADNVVSVTAIDPIGTEGAAGDNIIFRLSRTGIAAAQTVTVLVQGTATTSDYTFSPTPVSVSPFQTWIIPAGVATLDITATIVDDTTTEGPETLILGVIPTGGVSTGTPQTATATIIDNETSLPSVSIVAVDEDADENDPGNPAVFELRRIGSLTGSLSVNIAFTSGAGFATAGVDFIAPVSPIVIPDGQSSVLVTIPAINDSDVEGLENIQLSVTSGSGYRTVAPTSAIARIADDDINTVSIVATDSTASEAGSNQGIFTITRTGNTTNALRVDYLIGGNALLGVDYQALPGFVLIPAGSSSAAVVILPIDDDLGESSQTVILYLRSSTLYTTANPVSATVTITDDDTSVASVIASDGVAAEPSDAATFKFTVRGGTGTKPVKFALAGTAILNTDYTLSGMVAGTTDTINVTANSTATLTITPINDSLLEDTESVTLTLLGGTGYVVDVIENTSSIIIRDNNLATSVSVANTPDRVTEGATSAKFYIARNGSTTSALAVNYSLSGTATIGSDYTVSLPSPVTIPAASAGIYIDVATINDTAPEPTESITLTILPGTSYGIDVPSSTLLITDNDGSPILARFPSGALAKTVVENSATYQITVELSAASLTEVSVDYSVQTTSATGGGADFTLNQATLTFAPGETTRTFPITVHNDTVPEAEEFVIVQLTNPSGATVPTNRSVFSLFILDDEPRLTVEAIDDVAHETGDTGVYRFTRSGTTATSLTVPFTVSGTATSGSDFTALPVNVTIPAGQSFADVTLTPRTDTLTEGTETVTVTISLAAAFTRGTQTSATISLLDAASNNAPVIHLKSPRLPGAALPAATGLMLETSVFEDGLPGPLTLQWSKQSGPGTVTFGTPTSPNTTAVFSTSGSYILRLTAGDGSLQSTLDIPVVTGATSLAWSSLDIGGSTAIPGQTVHGDGSILVESAGTSLTSTSDIARFVYQPFSGDGEIIARARRLSNTSTSARAGIMIRESTAANARGAYLAGGPLDLFGIFSSRSTSGGSWSSSNGTSRPPMWLRLVKSGNNFTGYESVDGVTWIQRGNTTSVTVGSTPLVGFVAMSSSTTKPAVAEFDSIFITGSRNLGPVVNAGADQNVLTTTASLTAITSDDARPDPYGTIQHQWIQTAGPATALIASPATISTSVSFPASGIYTFQISASDGEITTFDDVNVTVSVPTITLVATIPDAFEHWLAPGAYTLTRTGGTTQQLTVFHTSGGTAEDGLDYTTLGGSSIIAIGSASKTLTLTPLPDTLAEGPESASLTLTPSPTYFIGAPSSGNITIADLPIDQWRLDHFGADANTPLIAGDLADFNHNGIPHLMEYGLGHDPKSPVFGQMPLFSRDNNTLQLSYHRPVTATDVSFIVEWNTSLTDWSSSGVTQEVLSTTGGTQHMRGSVDLPATDRAFMRLRVTRP